MINLDLKPTSKAVKDYYAGLAEFDKHGVKHEMAVRSAFQRLLEHCSRRMGWTFVGEYKYKRQGRRPVSIDGGMVDTFTVPQAYWEAKDSQDDLLKEVQNKFETGYPRDNIVFQEPRRAILWQGGRQICDEDITKPNALVYVVQELFTYRSETQRDWESAVADFKPQIPDIARRVVELIDVERKENREFITAFNNFAEVCRSSVNPNLSDAAVEEMLVQHLLTERIFRTVFHNSDFTDRNIIAREIERVIHVLTARKFSREEFLKPLHRFYSTLEKRAESLDDYSQQQTFLNTVYEKFFQGFAVKQADTHGIVYTPQPIVDFMVRSVEEILNKEFGKSLSDEGVHIIDPFVGTGNFITRIIREIKKTSLKHKYAHELHCNEVMLLPYYVASMNIEHEYYEHTGEYKPFEGICLVDTFDLAEERDYSGIQTALFTAENTERVEKLRKIKLFVIVGNPPYNAHQINENDRNKKRPYPAMDRRVKATYSRDGTATNKNALSDPYVKAIRWASDQILDNKEGLVAFVSNNSFVHRGAFDGMRKHLANDFAVIYVLDLKGYARTSGESRRREKGNVFDDTIRVGVSISFFVKKRQQEGLPKIYYNSVEDYLTSQDKRRYLEQHRSHAGIAWQQIYPDQKHTWLTEGLQDDFEALVPLMANRQEGGTPKGMFEVLSMGISSNRDAWVFNLDGQALCRNMKATIDFYNRQVYEWSRTAPDTNLEDFIANDDSLISWSSSLKIFLKQRVTVEYDETRVRKSMYRPFCKSYLYFDRHFIHRRGHWHRIFLDEFNESENRVICLTGIGSRKPFHCLMTNLIPDLHLLSDTQCFPFYVYDEDGTNRRENITDWAVEQFASILASNLDKWQIFHYIYGLLHSPKYQEKYQANLTRELPRIPLPKSVEQFQAFVHAGERLADLHVNYESQKEHRLEKIENPDKPLNWRVEKMKLTKDKTAIIYNDFLTLAGVPPEAFDYRLRNRSVLDWIIDRYRIHTDKRSGIVNDPNRADDEEYIVKLIGKVITVSLETVRIVKALPGI